MSIIYNLMDETEGEFVSAAEWEAGLAFSGEGKPSAGTNVGIGFFLYDDKGRPIAACSMTPEQAMKQALYIARTAARMMVVQHPDAKPEEQLFSEGVRIIFERNGARPTD